MAEEEELQAELSKIADKLEKVESAIALTFDGA